MVGEERRDNKVQVHKLPWDEPMHFEHLCHSLGSAVGAFAHYIRPFNPLNHHILLLSKLRLRVVE